MSIVSKIAKKAVSTGGGILNSVLGYGSNPGMQNPFGIPNLDFLKTPIDLTGKFRPVDTAGSEALFRDYLGNINAPSSVDQVQSGVDSDTMRYLLEGIDTDTANQVGSLKSDFQDRGLGGPGMISDIEAAGLGDLRAGATRSKAGARLGYANSELERLKARENAARDAYGARYAAGIDTAKTDAGTYNDLLKTGASLSSDQQSLLAKLLTDLYSGGAKNEADTRQPGYLDTILRNVKIGLNIGGH